MTLLNSLVKPATIIALVIIVAIQSAFVFGEFVDLSTSQQLQYLLLILCSLLLIVLSVLYYKKYSLEQERKRFTGHKFISNEEYERRKSEQTKAELAKLKNSSEFKRWVNQSKTKEGYSNSKTSSTFKDQDNENFMKLWSSLQSELVGAK